MESLFLFADAFDPFSTYMIIIEAAVIMILSSIFSSISRRINVPSVLMLILTGILIQVGLESMHIRTVDLMPLLEILGVVGLIMIVLEAALELELTKEKLPLIGKSLMIALLSLGASIAGIALIIRGYAPMEWGKALLYATPLSVMSSAIIIPSVNSLIQEKKEFMIYESTFSDILGIMIFYFLIGVLETDATAAGIEFGKSFILTIIVAVIASYALIFFFKDMQGKARLFLLISVLLILYAAGKMFHLSPLLIILVFGMALANHQKVFSIFKNDWDEDDPIEVIEKEFHLITLESAFVVRTFFFVVFGMTITLSSLVNIPILLISLAILAALYIVRWITLRLFLGKNILPELYLAPRGLITILLFYAIPADFIEQDFDPGILLFVIIISSFVMTYGLVTNRKEPGKEQVEKE